MNIDDLLYSPITATKSKLILPESWVKVVSAIQSYDDGWKYATLAGGALRDLDLGRPIKDVDIFVPYDECMGEYLVHAMKIADIAITNLTEVPHDNNAASGCVNTASHFLFEHDGWKFEISQRFENFHDYRHVLDTFDLGLCMICLDGGSKVHRSWAYDEDVKNQTITVIRQTGGREVEHAQRLLKKYPSWSIVPLNRP